MGSSFREKERDGSYRRLNADVYSLIFVYTVLAADISFL